MMRALIISASIATLFFFPYPLSVVVIFLLALYIPLSGVALGIMLDALYFTEGAAPLPYATITGLIATLLGILVQRFIRTHVSVR